MAKVLIVDDEPHIRILLERILEAMEDEGLEIFSAGQGNDAWQIIHSQHPELVFLDIVMPDMSGFELCRRIKQELDPAGIHVVLLTARGQESDREKGKQAGRMAI
jgi:CheY-like chemotaxis protein